MMPPMPRKLVFIVNSQSRGGSTGRDWPARGAALRAQLGESGTYLMKRMMKDTEFTRHAL